MATFQVTPFSAIDEDIDRALQEFWLAGLINKDTLYVSLPRIVDSIEDILDRLSHEQFSQFIWETQNGARGEFCANRWCVCDNDGCGRGVDNLDAQRDEAYRRSIDLAGGK